VTDFWAKHLQVSRYGTFQLTDAIRPTLEIPIRPRAGYRIDLYESPFHRLTIPMLTAAVSAEQLFEVFRACLTPLGTRVHVVLESSHDGGPGTTDRERRDLDRPIFESYLCDFEDLFLNDGCTGIAVLSTRRPLEVQLDEHKQITIYGPQLKPFRRILREAGVPYRPRMKFLSEAEHLHHTTESYAEQFEDFAECLGLPKKRAVRWEADEE